MAAPLVMQDFIPPPDREGFLKLAKYPLIKHTDMLEEMRIEAVELCVSAIEKFPTNLEKATQMIKEGMDKKFGAPWHVVIGEGFSFEITYEMKNLLYMFTGGTHAALVW
eukprot:CAMPEP_0114249768 /NCGR_PEP_ID=MMETSP0058-20121206/14329_1 /TAXON_ID=36894 /ORGANISM="Pyramimonas parkeae, CCMP726" /LENGTH=108 /DNA_ID=CAMNT_0001363357 /DNA_START=294 /DNA_END=617 /DNA_ORIENTATION=+